MMGDKVTEVPESYLLSKASIRALVFTQWETGSIGQLSTEMSGFDLYVNKIAVATVSKIG